MRQPMIGVDAPSPEAVTVFQEGHFQKGSPAVASDGTIYCTSHWYSGNELLKAYSASGAERWVWTFPWASLSRPAVGPDGTVHLLAKEGRAEETSSNLYAINSDGTLKWKTGRAGDAAISPFPVIDAHGNVYAVFSNHLHRTSDTGEVIWALPTDRMIEGALAVGTDRLFLLNGTGWQSRLQAVSFDGDLLWEFKAPFDAQEIERLARQKIIEEHGAERASHTSIHIMFAPPQFVGTPLVAADGSVLVANQDGCLYSISKQGQMNWRLEQKRTLDENRAGDGAALAHIVFSGGLLALSADGTVLWEREGHFLTVPVVSQNGRIYVAQMHVASAYEADGSLAWRASIRGIPGPFPALTPEGAVCITTDWGFVYLLS